MYKLTLNLPNLSQGALVELDGLGVFANGEEHLIKNEEADNFRQRGSSGHSVYDEEGRWQGEVFKLGPTLIEAYKDRVGVDIEVYHAPKPEAEKKKTKKELEAEALAEKEAADAAANDKGGDS